MTDDDWASDMEPCCWICLSPEGPLDTPCACPHPVHKQCLARWQLQQAGRLEERFCRFCKQPYSCDWRQQLSGDGPLEPESATPVMAVSAGGRVFKLKVLPGPQGKAIFKQQIRDLLGYDSTADFDVVFECKVPASGEKVQLTGFDAFDAATHCASISAARRIARRRQQHVPHAHVRAELLSVGSSGAASPPGTWSAAGTSSYRPYEALHESCNSIDASLDTLEDHSTIGWLPLPPQLLNQRSSLSRSSPPRNIPATSTASTASTGSSASGSFTSASSSFTSATDSFSPTSPGSPLPPSPPRRSPSRSSNSSGSMVGSPIDAAVRGIAMWRAARGGATAARRAGEEGRGDGACAAADAAARAIRRLLHIA